MKYFDKLNLVFIVGCQRSGTTMIGTVMGAHPNAYLIDEPDGLYQWVEGIFAGENEAKTIQLFRQCCKNARKNYLKPDTRCNEQGVLSENITHIILKAPNLTYSAEKIRENFSKLFCIFPYRDLRDVVVSMSKLDWIPMVHNQVKHITADPAMLSRFQEEVLLLKHASLKPHQARAYIARIKTSLRDTFAATCFRKLEVRYEDIVVCPELWTEKLFSHTQLAKVPEKINHTKTMLGWGPGLHLRRSKIHSLSVGKWQTVLTRDQESDIWEITKSLMQQLGYQRNPGIETRATKWDNLKSSLKNKPVIATGRGGSGTRLLSKLLQHMGVFLGNDRNITEDSVEWAGVFYKMAVESIRLNSHQSGKDHYYGVRETAAEILISHKWDGIQPWGWKLPETMLVLPEVFEVFNEGVFIHILRHPVDISIRRTHVTSRTNNPVGHSVLNAAYRSLHWDLDRVNTDPGHLLNAASWHYQVSEASRFGREVLGPERYLEIRYEDICSNPLTALITLSEFLNIELESSQVNLDIEPQRYRNWSPPDPRANEVWEFCGDLAMQLGYKSIDSQEI